MRTLVSYDDISAPQNADSAQLGPPLPSTNQPPAKRRKTHQKGPSRRASQQTQHWDDPGNTGDTMNYGDGGNGNENQDDDDDDEESRDLTHEEIWDDSALIDAWNSATAEYEAYHGKAKKWKEEPIKRSPLWYNIPPSPSKSPNEKSVSNGPSVIAGSLEDSAQNSQTLNFDTYIPTHDPTLSSSSELSRNPGASAAYPQSYLPGPNGAGTMASQDEAFEKALNAMYWSGYWTAVYHYHRQSQTQNTSPVEGDGNEGEVVEEEDTGDTAMDDDLVETQR